MIALSSALDETTPQGRLVLLRALLKLRMPPRLALARLAKRGDPDAVELLGPPPELTVVRDPPPGRAQVPVDQRGPRLRLFRFPPSHRGRP